MKKTNLQRFLPVVVFAILMLTGCDAATTDVSHRYDLLDGLKDCKVYWLQGKGMSADIAVLRCPNSSTAVERTVHQGKTSHTYYSSVTEDTQ